jgi:hypothetical protein
MNSPEENTQHPANVIRQDLGLAPLPKEHFDASRAKMDSLVKPDPYTVAMEAEKGVTKLEVDESQVLKGSSEALKNIDSRRANSKVDEDYDDDPSIMGAYADSKDTAHASSNDGGQSPSTPWHR